jgi:hypothetical protein
MFVGLQTKQQKTHSPPTSASGIAMLRIELFDQITCSLGLAKAVHTTQQQHAQRQIELAEHEII